MLPPTAWNDIKKQLLDGTYVPSTALRVEIPKESGGMRRLGIPCASDRALQRSTAEVLSAIYGVVSRTSDPSMLQLHPKGLELCVPHLSIEVHHEVRVRRDRG